MLPQTRRADPRDGHAQLGGRRCTPLALVLGALQGQDNINGFDEWQHAVREDGPADVPKPPAVHNDFFLLGGHPIHANRNPTVAS